jgi:hypothetical protein
MITETGDYLTRDGTKVTIHEIRLGTSTFEAKGSIWKMFRGKLRPRGYDIWKTDGQYTVNKADHKFDIVERIF